MIICIPSNLATNSHMKMWLFFFKCNLNFIYCVSIDEPNYRQVIFYTIRQKCRLI